MSTLEERIAKRNEKIKTLYPYNEETWISITQIKETIRPAFDKQKIAMLTYKKHFANPDSEYYQMLPAEIIKKWEDKAEKAISNGKAIDAFAEFLFNNESSPADYIEENGTTPELKKKLSGLFKFIEYTKSQDCIFKCREQQLLMPFEYKNKVYVINGRFDAMFDFNGRNILIDWKNNDEIKETNPFEKLYGPCSKLQNCDSNLFTLQLYFYKFILEEIYQIGIEKEYIVQFSGTKPEDYIMHETWFEYDPDLIEETIKFIIDSKNSNNKMTREERLGMFSNELNLIANPNMRKFCEYLLEKADDYFFTMPASTTGKYHPAFALGDGGLVRHTRAVVFNAYALAEAKGYSSDMKDAIVVAAITHDIKKKGNDGSQFTVKEHPECAVKFIVESYDGYQGEKPDQELLADITEAVLSHMGQWGETKPETDIQFTLHQADYLASRKQFNMDFSVPVEVRKETTTAINENAEPGDVVFPFGKYTGKTISEVYNENAGYLKWIIGNADFKATDIKDAVIKFIASH